VIRSSGTSSRIGQSTWFTLMIKDWYWAWVLSLGSIILQIVRIQWYTVCNYTSGSNTLLSISMVAISWLLNLICYFCHGYVPIIIILTGYCNESTLDPSYLRYLAVLRFSNALFKGSTVSKSCLILSRFCSARTCEQVFQIKEELETNPEITRSCITS